MTYNQAPNSCDECSLDVHDNDAAPTCGAHIIHLSCRGAFHCRWCDEEWKDANQ